MLYKLLRPLPLVAGSTVVKVVHCGLRRDVSCATVLTFLAGEGGLLISNQATCWQDLGTFTGGALLTCGQ